MGLTMGTARSGNISLGAPRNGTLTMGSNTGFQPTAASTGVTLGQGVINQTPVSGGGGGGNTQNPVDTYNPGYVTPAAPVGPSRAQLDPLLASLASLDEILGNRNRQSRDEYGRAIKGYNAQDALDRKMYNDNVFKNENAFTSNNQAAELNAANGATGLRGVLSSLGGLAGSGKDVVARLVGLAANQDLGAADENFEANATNLNQSWSQAEQEQRQRRADAEATLDNNLQNNEAGVLTSKQNIYQQLANAYGDQLPEGQEYASKASALAAPIAKTTRASVAPYAKASASFSPGALQEYLAGTQNLAANTTGESMTPINSPIYSTNRKKDQLSGVA